MEPTIILPPVKAFGTLWTKELLGLNPAVPQREVFSKQVSSTAVWCLPSRTEQGSNVVLPTPPALHSCVKQKPAEVSKDVLHSYPDSAHQARTFLLLNCALCSAERELLVFEPCGHSPPSYQNLSSMSLPSTPVTSCAALFLSKCSHSFIQALHASGRGIFGVLKTSFSCVL